MNRPKVMPPTHARSLISGAIRPLRSEGHAVAMIPMDRTSSGDVVGFGLDLATAPVPSRRYAADVCFVELEDGAVKFVFGQRGLSDFESALIVRMNPHAARQFLDSLREMNSPSIKELAAMVDAEMRPQRKIGEARQSVGVVANIAAVALTTWEGCIDFYHASAFAFRAFARKSGHLEVEPVVRVDLSMGLFLGLVDALERLASQLPPLQPNS